MAHDFFVEIKITGVNGYSYTGSHHQDWLMKGDTVVFTDKIPYASLLPGSKYYFYACADAGNKVLELNENNNCSRETYIR